MDLWLLSMYHTYHSLIGVCNVVFGVAMIAMSVRFWNEVNVNWQAALFFLCLIIPVFHPLGVWMKAKAQMRMIPQGTELRFAENGLEVTLGEKKEQIPWKKIKGAKREGNMIILFTGGGHGYMLTDRVLGDEKEEFYSYVKAHVYASENQTSGKRKR